MSPPRITETLANGLAVDPLFCDVPANLFKHEVDLESVVEISEFRFSES